MHIPVVSTKLQGVWPLLFETSTGSCKISMTKKRENTIFQRSNLFGKHGAVAIRSQDALVCFQRDVYQVEYLAPSGRVFPQSGSRHQLQSRVKKLEIPSLKLTFSHLKMDGWNTILSFWDFAYFQVRLLLVYQRLIRVVSPVTRLYRRPIDDRCSNFNDNVLLVAHSLRQQNVQQNVPTFGSSSQSYQRSSSNPSWHPCFAQRRKNTIGRVFNRCMPPGC